MPQNRRSPIAEHILPVSSNLLAICFAVVALMAARKMTNSSIIDDCADWIFLAGLGFLVIVTGCLVVGVAH